MPTAVESWAPPLNHGSMAAPPLTHHDILELAAPFSRRERHVDLAASDRMQRTLLFKPLEHPGDGGRQPRLQVAEQREQRDGDEAAMRISLRRDGTGDG